MDFVSFFLFWLCSLPAIWFPVHKVRHLFTVKAYFVPPAGIAFFIWSIVKAHGIGPIVHQGSTKSGGALGWAMVQGIMSSIANFATLIVNDPDFARFARKPRDALWSQFITIPFGFAITSFIGIIVSSSSTVTYGQPIWNPLDLLGYFLINPNTGKNANGPARFGVFIISFAFALAQLGTNISANSVSAGTDMTALLPRYLNIRRGGYICAAVGLAMCPWLVHLNYSCVSFLANKNPTGISSRLQITSQPIYLPTQSSSPPLLASSSAIITLSAAVTTKSAIFTRLGNRRPTSLPSAFTGVVTPLIFAVY